MTTLLKAVTVMTKDGTRHAERDWQPEGSSR